MDEGEDRVLNGLGNLDEAEGVRREVEGAWLAAE